MTTSAAQLRVRFWTDYKYYVEKHSAIRCATPSVDDWMDHQAGLNGGVLYTILRTRLGEVGIQFALNDATAATIYAYLRRHRLEIDGVFEKRPRWHDPKSARTSLIEVRRRLTIEDESLWPEHFAWLLRHLLLFQEVLMPLVGRVPPAPPGRIRWDENTFFDELTKVNPSAVAPAYDLYDWCTSTMGPVTWGRGKRTGSFIPRFIHLGLAYEPISVWTSGVVVLRFVDLRRSPPWDKVERRGELLAQVNRTPLFALPPEVVNQRPAVPVRMLADGRVFAGFTRALTWCMHTSRAFRYR